MRRVIRISSVFGLLYFILFASVAFGAEYDYYVYNGYDSAVNAWHKVSLIFGGNDYLGVLFLAAVVGALVLFYAILVRAALGARVDPLRGFGVPFLGGLILGALFIIPKDSLVIYDPVSARGPQRIDGIPRIVALAAFISNKVERLMIDIIDNVTISESGKYSRNAGGVSYSVLKELYTKAQLDDCSVTSLSNYMQDCVLPQVNSLEQSGLIQKVKSGEVDFFELLSNAAHPSLFVTVCNPSTKASETKTCESAYNQNIAPIRDKYSVLLSSTGDFIKSACSQLGFSDSLIGLQQCRSLISSTFNDIAFSAGFTSNTGIGLESAKRQYDIARIWRLVLLSNDPALATATIATSQTMSSFWGLGVHANSWLPVIKASVTSLAIALTPVVLILLVTPLAGRALSFVFGVFIWITCWTLVDALVLSLGNDLANYYASSLKSGTQTVGFGSTVSFVFPEFLEKVIATFGMLRWAGLGLATVLSTMLVRFGGTVMAMVAGQITSAPMGAGASVGGQVAVSPSSLLTGTVLPMETYGSVAVRSGGLGALYSPLFRMETFGLSSKAYAGDVGIKGDAFTAGRYAGSVQAVQLQSQTETGTFTFGQERRLGEGLGRLGALDILNKGEAGLKFSPEEIPIIAKKLASATAANIRKTAGYGSVWEGKEELAYYEGMHKGLLDLRKSEAIDSPLVKIFDSLLKQGYSVDYIRSIISALQEQGINALNIEKINNEAAKARQLGIPIDKIDEDSKVEEQLKSNNLDPNKIRQFLALNKLAKSLNLTVEQLSSLLALADYLEGFVVSEGKKIGDLTLRGQAKIPVEKLLGYSNFPQWEKNMLYSMMPFYAEGGKIKVEREGIPYLLDQKTGELKPLWGVHRSHGSSDTLERNKTIGKRWAEKTQGSEQLEKSKVFHSVIKYLTDLKNAVSSKNLSSIANIEAKLADLINSSLTDEEAVKKITDIFFGGISIGSVGFSPGRGGGIGGGGGINVQGPSFQGPQIGSKHQDVKTGKLTGTVKQDFNITTFHYKNVDDFIRGFEKLISAATGNDYTTSEGLRRALSKIYDKSKEVSEHKAFSDKESSSKELSTRGELFATLFNIYRNKYENPIDIIGAVIEASADPVKLGELLDIKVREKEQREKEVSEEVNATVNEIEKEIERIKEKVPTDEGIQGKGRALRSRYNALEKSVSKEHDKAQETLNKTAEKFVKTVLEHDEKGQAIYENSGLGGKIESIEPKYRAYRNLLEYSKKHKEISPLGSRSNPISVITSRPLDKTPFIPRANVGLPSAPKGLNK